jgi:hypothetical protein
MSEDNPGLPGWADEKLDEIFAEVPDSPAIAAARERYAACLAATRPSEDPDEAHDRCRHAVLEELANAGVGRPILARLFDELEVLEAEISEGT